MESHIVSENSSSTSSEIITPQKPQLTEQEKNSLSLYKSIYEFLIPLFKIILYIYDLKECDYNQIPLYYEMKNEYCLCGNCNSCSENENIEIFGIPRNNKNTELPIFIKFNEKHTGFKKLKLYLLKIFKNMDVLFKLLSILNKIYNNTLFEEDILNSKDLNSILNRLISKKTETINMEILNEYNQDDLKDNIESCFILIYNIIKQFNIIILLNDVNYLNIVYKHKDCNLKTSINVILVQMLVQLSLTCQTINKNYSKSFPEENYKIKGLTDSCDLISKSLLLIQETYFGKIYSFHYLMSYCDKISGNAEKCKNSKFDNDNSKNKFEMDNLPQICVSPSKNNNNPNVIYLVIADTSEIHALDSKIKESILFTKFLKHLYDSFFPKITIDSTNNNTNTKSNNNTNSKSNNLVNFKKVADTFNFIKNYTDNYNDVSKRKFNFWQLEKKTKKRVYTLPEGTDEAIILNDIILPKIHDMCEKFLYKLNNSMIIIKGTRPVDYKKISLKYMVLADKLNKLFEKSNIKNPDILIPLIDDSIKSFIKFMNLAYKIFSLHESLTEFKEFHVQSSDIYSKIKSRKQSSHQYRERLYQLSKRVNPKFMKAKSLNPKSVKKRWNFLRLFKKNK